MGTQLRTFLVALCLLAVAARLHAQNPPVPAPINAAPSGAISADLDRLRAAASEANLEIAHMRIEKWKADGASKQQAQANADSLQRNLTSALPGLIDNFRAAPQDLSAGFRLYRNLNALYDVLASFTEATGAFGPRNEYDALAQQLMVIDSVRRDLGDNLENLASSKQTELIQLHSQLQSLQQAAAAAPPPKKVVVDDTEPVKKTVHKKKPAPASTTNGSSVNTQAAPQPSAKSQ